MTAMRALLATLALACSPAHGLDLPSVGPGGGGGGMNIQTQLLPPAPGLAASEPLDPLEGVREAVNCGLSFLDGVKRCGLTSISDAASPFLVRFSPLYCRATMRFPVGQLITNLLSDWIAGALPLADTPLIGPLCFLGVGPQYCGASVSSRVLKTRVSPSRSAVLAAPPAAPAQAPAAPPTTDSPTTDEGSHDHPTGLDSLTR
jgi:hypothetical protein